MSALHLIVALGICGAANAETDVARAREDRIAELERKVEILIQELERTRTEIAVPEEMPLEYLLCAPLSPGTFDLFTEKVMPHFL